MSDSKSYMSDDSNDRRPASVPGPMRCTRCDCTFKRSEHLKRHERIHDSHKRFACSQCSKLFTRSDILRRHEATHAAIEQANNSRPARTRACTECAKSRERCSKMDPCQRCSTRGLHCTYPQPRASARNRVSNLDRDREPSSSLSSVPQAIASTASRSEDQITSDLATQHLDRQLHIERQGSLATYAPYNSLEEQAVPYGMPEPMNPGWQGSQVMQLPMDFPMNWLPPDDSIPIDYDNILGFGFSSLDFFAVEHPATDIMNPNIMPHSQGSLAHPTTFSQQPADPTAQPLVPSPLDGTTSGTWAVPSTEPVEKFVTSDSPHSTTHSAGHSAAHSTTHSGTYSTSHSGVYSGTYSSIRTMSPSAAPGGLYSTSINGARMPCTIRARRANRLIPGATPIDHVSDLKHRYGGDFEGIGFPELGHIFVDHITSDVEPLTTALYETIQCQFTQLCLSDSGVFQRFASPRFPTLPMLNLFVQLYFDNFDEIVPILHDQVTRVNGSWILALAVCAIGCQYAEANEFSRSVEPMHEFLQRAIRVELNSRNTQILGKDEEEISLAQAITLNQIGMLYFGSQRLLQVAQAQHSTLGEIARSMTFATLAPSTGTPEFLGNGDSDFQNRTWRKLLVEECKRRVGYTIWLLDCMAAFHFAHQPSMPPDLFPVPLPNDKLWMTKTSEDWVNQCTSVQDSPSLSSAIVSIFREKHVAPDLGQFSRIILLHGVFREVFYVKDLFAGPLGDWVPSMQTLDAVDYGANGAFSDVTGGRTVLESRRNAALDCVDVLHWAANGTIAQQAGAEHPTVLHLHLSRTVVLSPLGAIRNLADSIVSFIQNPPPVMVDAARRKQVMDSEREVLEWAQRDQCKARLAVLHSGCLFWHIRRYSCKAFYEPISVFLATLTIWAYSSYASRSTGPHQKGSIRRFDERHDPANPHSFPIEHLSNLEVTGSSPYAASDDEDTEPTFIHLDRPNDDEMVQAFVRLGTSARMRANITGVGDIYSSNGPAKILKEGRKLLATLSTAWGRTDVYVNALEVLEQVASGRTVLNAT